MSTATPRMPGGRAGSGPGRAANRWDFLTRSSPQSQNPWNPLWAMMIGFFMIMVDSTIVAVANPTIMTSLHIGYDAVVWVTSAYLLGYAVALLVAGRLGDRFGPKNLYLIGLAVFTAASLWCGLAGSVDMLIAARVVQGVGAALLTPQTLSTITRIFPAERRGVAMSVWGATAGVATPGGPAGRRRAGRRARMAVDLLRQRAHRRHRAWRWRTGWFRRCPPSRTGSTWSGVALSGVGMFLIVFALQEGQAAHWAAVDLGVDRRRRRIDGGLRRTGSRSMRASR